MEQHLIFSLIQTIHKMILKNPPFDVRRLLYYFATTQWPAGESYEDAVRQGWKSNIYRLFLSLSSIRRFLTILQQNPTGSLSNSIFDLMYSPYLQADDSGENGLMLLRSSGKVTEWNTSPWRVHSWYSGESWSERNRQASSKTMKIQSFRVTRSAWSFPALSVWTRHPL